MEDETTALTVPNERTQIGELMKLAISKGKDIDVNAMEKLADLYERMADRSAAQEFSDALAAFQSDCPEIEKTTKANISTKSGVRYSYNYADLDHIVKTVRPILRKHGLSFTWDSKAEGQVLTASVTLRHINGHKESSSFSCPTSAISRMSDQQAFAAANTFARRQALVQVLGLTTTEPDADGGPVHGSISPTQVADLEALIEEVGADRARFLKFLDVTDLSDLPVDRFKSAVSALERKRK